MKARVLIALVSAFLFAALAHAARTGAFDYPEPSAAPNFNLQGLDGKTYNLADFRGKPLLIKFWATYCKPCIKEMPTMDTLYQEVSKEGIQIVGINVGDSKEAIHDFEKRIPMSFPILMDPESMAASEYFVRGLPTSFIINANGEIVMKVIGAYHWEGSEALEKLRSLTQG